VACGERVFGDIARAAAARVSKKKKKKKSGREAS